MEENKIPYEEIKELTENWSKELFKAVLCTHIVIYLERLQSGKYGVPTLDELNDAGMLHSFLESKVDRNTTPEIIN